MSADSHYDRVPWFASCWMFSLLALVGLAACGASNQGALGAGNALLRATEAATAGVSQPTTEARQPITATPTTTAKNMQSSSSPTLPSGINARPTEAANPAPALSSPAAPATASVSIGAWQTYRSAKGGFQVDYPADWTTSERDDASGRLTTTFAPASGGTGIAVIVRSGGPLDDNSDIPNLRCYTVTVGSLSGKRCIDTIAFSVSTTLIVQDKTYTVATSTKRTDQSVYQHLLDSFVAGP